ncbi:cysteine desulfurase selenocysteine lyase family plp dependent transferase superfamily protein [Cystoisospora suis]|uniref:Cysteine desulfurase selenocysteine lyase family plp dependent transferase superfamily protein n=1 Tax=Cystoisospora suis TaxID=483139 RepID=A0A2C6KWH7_9APIC|nr:cysteine desulfurase selenocysteine lyase family plp dependent transferase superfamily protein [Cystoisospora suis]
MKEGCERQKAGLWSRQQIGSPPVPVPADQRVISPQHLRCRSVVSIALFCSYILLAETDVYELRGFAEPGVECASADSHLCAPPDSHTPFTSSRLGNKESGHFPRGSLNPTAFVSFADASSAASENLTAEVPLPLWVPDDKEALAAAAVARRHTEGCSGAEEQLGEDTEGLPRGIGGADGAEERGMSVAKGDSSDGSTLCGGQGKDTDARDAQVPPDRYHASFTAAQLYTSSEALKGSNVTKVDQEHWVEHTADEAKGVRGCPLWGGTYDERRTRFLQQYGDVYNVDIEQVQKKELSRFAGQVYMDYAGSGVYQQQQLRDIFDDLSRNSYGNAHSRNPSAKHTDVRLKEARETVLRFFDASEQDYAVIFTSGATAALKIVGESFPFAKDLSSFYYLRINHNSVLGMREYAYAKKAKSVRAVSPREVERLLKEREAAAKTQHSSADQTAKETEMDDRPNCLFAFPSKDNWNGRFFPLNWIQRVKTFGLSDDNCRWFVLVDAAAHAPTSPLSLTQYPADFVSLSFYKMFGYPTGLGALLARSEDKDKLERLYWGGGSVVASLSDGRWCKRKEEFSLRFEDGTLPFLGIVESLYGFRILEKIGLERIHKHVAALTRHLFERLQLLRHSNGAPAIILYWNEPDPPEGGIVNFNVLRPDGSFVPFPQVSHISFLRHRSSFETAASAANIHLRTGFFCNPGGAQDFLGLTADDIMQASQKRQSCSDAGGVPGVSPANSGMLTLYGGGGLGGGVYRKPVGSVRLSLGYLSTFDDVDTVVSFVSETYLW